MTASAPDRSAITAFLVEADHHLRENERYHEFRHSTPTITEQLLRKAMDLINALDTPERLARRMGGTFAPEPTMTPPKETTIIQPALLPCPLCQGEAEYTWNQLYSDNTVATCRSCGCSAFWRKWNTRSQPAPVEQDVERLAYELRERSRYPSGGPRLSPEKAREIATASLSTLTPARAEGFKAGVVGTRCKLCGSFAPASFADECNRPECEHRGKDQ